ncbi:MAG: c-type cytochrome [Planctomycetota bacterium]|nr:c-type cytochrome [Planctomycetota bacterium]MDA1250674.1 c-type cytochrome [Planctomycetota bacterium]
MSQLCGLPGRLSVLLLTAVFAATALTSALAEDPPAVPTGLPAVGWPADNPPTAAKISLGQQLYFDPRLSSDDTISCASCHDPAKGWSNGEAFAKGVGGALGGRSAPTIINSAYFRQQFWDGRAKTLEDQALGPIQAGVEMNMKLENLIQKLNKIEGYKSQFKAVFGSEASAPNVAKAIAAYERTVLSGNAPYDSFKAGDKDALSEVAERGRKVFFGKGHCSACHVGAALTDNSYHNVGVGMDKKEPDVGRFAVSKLEGDTGAFKTPGLRDIARSAPYMHDGSLKTLEDVVEHYAKGGIANEYLDEEIFKLKLTDQDKKDLITFLKEGLASREYPMHKAPKLPK